MSQFCPLCGNSKKESAVFCESCSHKIEKEYEVEVSKEDTLDVDFDNVTKEDFVTHNSHGDKVNIETEDIKPQIDTNLAHTENKGKNRTFINVLWGVVIIAIVSAAFVIYKNTIHRSNIEKSVWSEAEKENSIDGYLRYMLEFPKGKNYNNAEASIMSLKRGEADSWESLQQSDNSAQLKDFITQHPNSSYKPLIRHRLDSLSWCASLKDNTSEGYNKYIDMALSDEFDGYYTHQAKERYELLTQKQPIDAATMDSIKHIADGFFVALSSVKAENIERYLAPNVFQFFNLRSGNREKIVGELMISGSKTQSPTIKFVPNIKGITYEKTLIDHYKINVPLHKYITKDDGSTYDEYGFIIQMELDHNMQIITASENKPMN